MKPAVLVTGAAKRIGATIARTFGEAGWHVVIHYGHSHDAAAALAAELPSAEPGSAATLGSGSGLTVADDD